MRDKPIDSELLERAVTCCKQTEPRFISRADDLQRLVRRFRVSLERVLPDPDVRNPFLAYRTAENFENAKCKVLVRTWEFDAADEQEVRRLLDEARRDGEPQVQGMRIRSIEEISPNDKALRSAPTAGVERTKKEGI